MNSQELELQLDRLLHIIQRDPGQRGLARDPADNLFTATMGHFAAACRSLAEHPQPRVQLWTGFWIPSATPPAFETDGPLGADFLAQAFDLLEIPVALLSEPELQPAFPDWPTRIDRPTHWIAIERPGPAADGTIRTMRGRDISAQHLPLHQEILAVWQAEPTVTIGVGDGGNEIGMGCIPAGTMQRNIPRADEIHCRVSVEHLVVAGVSNWGAYALAAGVALLRGQFERVRPLFDPQREFERLSRLLQKVTLVDGVRGISVPTVDGLSWEDYAQPLLELPAIVNEDHPEEQNR